MTENITPPADVPVTAFSAGDAAAMLVSMSAAFKAANPTPGPWGLDPEAAGKQLSEMADAYRKANAPKLAVADQTVLGESAGPPRELGETVTWPEISVRNKLSVIEELRSTGIPDQGIARFVRGESYSKEDFEAAQRWKQRAENDPAPGQDPERLR